MLFTPVVKYALSGVKQYAWLSNTRMRDLYITSKFWFFYHTHLLLFFLLFSPTHWSVSLNSCKLSHFNVNLLSLFAKRATGFDQRRLVLKFFSFYNNTLNFIIIEQGVNLSLKSIFNVKRPWFWYGLSSLAGGGNVKVFVCHGINKEYFLRWNIN